MDGLEFYNYRQADLRFSSEIMQHIQTLEEMGRQLRVTSLNFMEYLQKNAAIGETFLKSLERFLISTSEDGNDYALFNKLKDSSDLMACLWQFQHSKDRKSGLRALHRLVSAGDTVGIGPLRSLTAIARLIQPHRWAVLSWRVLACVGFTSITHLREARYLMKPEEMKKSFLQVDLDTILDAYLHMEKLIAKELSTVSAVSMALYNLSLCIWPAELPFDQKAEYP